MKINVTLRNDREVTIDADKWVDTDDYFVFTTSCPRKPIPFRG